MIQSDQIFNISLVYILLRDISNSHALKYEPYKSWQTP